MDASLREQQLANEERLVKEQYNLLKEERLAYERQSVSRAIKRVQADRAFESYSINGQQFIDKRDYLPVGWGFDHGLFGGAGVGLGESSPQQRANGEFPPFITSEGEIAQYRSMARFVSEVTCPGKGIATTLQNYVIGKGFSFTAGTKKQRKVPESLIEAVQDVIDEFLDDNDFQGDLDRELLWRGSRDGEFFTAMMPRKGGRTSLRVIEPEQVTECRFPEIEARVGDVNWSFGVATAGNDVGKRFGYCVEWDTGDIQFIPDRYMEHHRCNVDRNVKRGLTDFFPACQRLLLNQRLLTNTGEGAAELAAISYIVQHAQGVDEARARAMREAAADYTYTRNTPTGQKTVYKEHREPGTKLDVPQGQEYLAGPSGHERGNAFLEVAQGIFRDVGTRWSMTEGMISGDDSNNNFASSITAGGRFHRYAICRQHNMSMRFARIIWKALKNAYTAGRFARFGFGDGQHSFLAMTRFVEVNIKPPDVDELGKLDAEQIRQLRLNSKIISVKTYREEAGINHDTEEAQTKLEAAQQPIAPMGPDGQPVPGDPNAQGNAPGNASGMHGASAMQGGQTAAGPQPQQIRKVTGKARESAESVDERKYSCLMASLSPWDADAVRGVSAGVDEGDLAIKGREVDPHVTIKYGLITDDVGAVLPLLSGIGPFEIELGEVGLFASADHDVVKVEVESRALRALNEMICSNLPYVDKYPEYIPHMTLAYVKPGLGGKYVGENPLAGMRFRISRLVFSPVDGDKVTIPLTGEFMAIESAVAIERADGGCRWITTDSDSKLCLSGGKVAKGPDGLVGKPIGGVKPSARSTAKPVAQKPAAKPAPKAQAVAKPAEKPEEKPAGKTKPSSKAEWKGSAEKGRTMHGDVDGSYVAISDAKEVGEMLESSNVDVSYEQLHAIAGAGRESNVTIEPKIGPIGNFVRISVKGPGYMMERDLYLSGSKPVMWNKFFFVDSTGKGLGTSLLAKQVNSLHEAGIDKIETHAMRGKGTGGANGYYTWARLGYDAKLPKNIASQSPVKGAKLVSDLMKTPEGRAYWKTNGESLNMVFDTRPGSYSRTTLELYMKEKGYRAAESAWQRSINVIEQAADQVSMQATSNEPDMGPDDDEDVFARVFDAVAKSGVKTEESFFNPETISESDAAVESVAVTPGGMPESTSGVSIRRKRPISESADCGTGAGGFQKGNTCASGGRGGSDSSRSGKLADAMRSMLRKAYHKYRERLDGQGIDRESERHDAARSAIREFEKKHDVDMPAHVAQKIRNAIVYNTDPSWDDLADEIVANELPRKGPVGVRAIAREPYTPPPPGDSHDLDPRGDVDGDGIHDASRVGVPGDSVPPPPAIPQLPKLTADERYVESEFARRYESDPDGMATELRRKMAAGEVGDGPHVFGTDDAKLLSPHYNASKENRSRYNLSVHQTANALTKRAFLQHLDEVVSQLPEGDRTVLVTAGGVASGKDYAIGRVDDVSRVAKSVAAVWNSAGEQNATEMQWLLDETEKRGISTTFVYVHADPGESWNRVLSRAKKSGRMVDARLYAESYAYGANNFQRFYEQHKEGSGAKFVFLDGRGVPKEVDGMPDEAFDVDVKRLHESSIEKLNDPSVEPYIKRGGSIGLRVWGAY